MAALIPPLEQINNFPKKLEPGERALMEALLAILDDDWTIYVQPFLNGLQPDIIILSEQAGLGIFEVKDWNLDCYRISNTGRWGVYDGHWHDSAVRCPFSQVKHYKDSIIHYELPELQAEIALNNQMYGVVSEFIYFHNHTKQQALDKVKPILIDFPYTVVFGNDCLEPRRLQSVLNERYLRKGSYFSEIMQRHGLQNRLRNALSYPEHGRLKVSDILFELPKRHKQLLSNAPGKRRVIGSAGSGKTMIIARKAVNAAMNGQKVLVVCFNITMVNYLNDIIHRLARYKSKGSNQVDRLILIRHYHRLFPMSMI
jgi:hypothetical protein